MLNSISFKGVLKNKADQRYPHLRPKIDAALKEMGPDYVLGEYKKHWTEDNPENGYCHAVTEVLLRSDIVPSGSVAWRVPTEEGSHYCIKTPSGDILDFTDRQHFAKPVDYEKGESKKLVETAERYSDLEDATIMRIPVLAKKLGIQLKPLPSLKKLIKNNREKL